MSGLKRDRVRDYLLDLIEQHAPGTPLPSERDLAQELGVSRPTLRAAVEDLTQAGLLVRQHGRGTFTSPNKVNQQLSGTSTNAFAVPPAEGTWLSAVLEFETFPAGAAMGSKLQLSPSEPVLRIVRLRTVDGEPISIERIHVPHDLVRGLEAADMEQGNFYHLLRTRFGVTVSDAVQTIEPTVTDPEESSHLAVPLHAPALLVERTTRDTTARLVEFTRSIYRGDRYRITSHLKFDPASG
ncbi:GntR family transcriptional regulator [Actinocorallia sp. A-T 12471]|uniref:GntR family transcriptional regulator n=1 Tax=Actinocorallia sp. A-T 12471 TaxID=3089813 RepID=UPI0029CC28D0|nr:GntR family transcriptional regulator [Actinocorallia sp. A-T 12471]MDX6739522.1 GntR family transcriptional regulator [Actinocorallia sp. A-T 12471]